VELAPHLGAVGGDEHAARPVAPRERAHFAYVRGNWFARRAVHLPAVARAVSHEDALRASKNDNPRG